MYIVLSRQNGTYRPIDQLHLAVILFSEKSWIIAGLKADKSLGPRLVTQFPSPTTCWSTQLPPALRMSSWMEGQLVSVRPLTSPDETSSQGAWQMTANGLPAACIRFTNSRAFGCILMSSASKLSGFAWSRVISTLTLPAFTS